MNRFQRRRQAAIARGTVGEDIAGEWRPSAVPPETLACTICRVEAKRHALDFFWRLPDGWLSCLCERDGQALLITVCSDACAEKWMAEHLFRTRQHFGPLVDFPP